MIRRWRTFWSSLKIAFFFSSFLLFTTWYTLPIVGALVLVHRVSESHFFWSILLLKTFAPWILWFLANQALWTLRASLDSSVRKSVMAILLRQAGCSVDENTLNCHLKSFHVFPVVFISVLIVLQVSCGCLLFLFPLSGVAVFLDNMSKPPPSPLLYYHGNIPLSCPLIEFLVCDLLGPVYPTYHFQAWSVETWLSLGHPPTFCTMQW